MTELLIAAAGGSAAGAFLVWSLLSPKIRSAEERLRTAQDNLLREQATKEKIQGDFRLAASDTLKNMADQFFSSAMRDLRQVKTEADLSMENKKSLIEASVGEMKEKFESTQKLLQEFEKDRRELQGKFSESLSQVLQAENSIRMETGALRKALTSSIGVRGKWGEQVLKEILEQNGMIQGVNFEAQLSMSDDAGGKMRPDFTLYLPGGKKLAIDSKEVTGEFLLAQETEDPARQKQHYENLVANIRSNFNNLSRKEYQTQLDKEIPFVVMFIPSEAAIRAAFATDPSLYRDAVERRVMIASPMTIIPLIYLIKHSWQKQVLADNALELGSAVEVLGERLFKFIEHLNNIRAGLKKAVDGWNDGAASWQSRVSPQIEKANALGGKLKNADEPAPIEEALRPSLTSRENA